MKEMKLLRNIALFVLFIVPFVGSAQLAYFDNIDLKISPNDPSPGEIVSITVNAFSFDINQSFFTWYVGGSIYDQGIGLDEIKIEARSANLQSVVTVVVNTENGIILEEQIVIQPTEVTLLWEAQTETPIFYKGKTLHTPGSEIKLVAIPNLFQNGRKISSRNLVYTWEINNKVLGSLSGVGKSSITINNPTSLRDMKAEVFVETQDGLVHGRDTIIISVEKPEVYLYKEDLLLGRNYDNILQNTFSLMDKEIIVFAESFFFSPNTLSYSWKIDNKLLSTTGNKITIQSPEEGEALSSIDVSVKNSQKFLQSAESIFSISFGKSLLESLFNF